MEKVEDLLGLAVILTPKTNHGKQRVKEFGDEYRVVQFMPSPNRIKVLSINTGYERWVQESEDKHFSFKVKIKEIENKDFNPDWYSPTGNTIKDVLDEKGISIEDFAKEIGNSVKYVNELLDGKLVVVPSMAESLERVLGSTKDFWLRRDELYWSEKRRIEGKNK